jgi:hypothetical protein
MQASEASQVQMENKDLPERVDPRVTQEPQELEDLKDLKDLKELKDLLEVRRPFLET